jgi:hypothetical protein
MEATEVPPSLIKPLAYLVLLRCHRPIHAAGYPAFRMEESRRAAVLEAIRRVSRREKWTLRAAVVQEDKAAAVVECAGDPGIVIRAFQEYSSRLLFQRLDRAKKRWAGSDIRCLWREEDIAAAIRLVTESANGSTVYRESAAPRLGRWAAGAGA